MFTANSLICRGTNTDIMLAYADMGFFRKQYHFTVQKQLSVGLGWEREQGNKGTRNNIRKAVLLDSFLYVEREFLRYV
jgi:hypothetical protein